MQVLENETLTITFTHNIPDNRAFYIGNQAKIEVKGSAATLSYQ
jgi:hypothetical protein